MQYSSMITPETDLRLSNAWTRWIVAREQVEPNWRRGALLELLQCTQQAMSDEGVDMTAGDYLTGIALG